MTSLFLRNKRSIQLVCKSDGNEIKLTGEDGTIKDIPKETIASEFLNGGSLISDMACDKDDGSTKSVILKIYFLICNPCFSFLIPA